MELGITFNRYIMGKFIMILLFILISNCSIAQTIGYSKPRYISVVNNKGIQQKVETYVNQQIEQWQAKGRYEKVADYQKRVTTETREQKIEELTQYKVNELANTVISLSITSIDYDAENEVFKIDLNQLPAIYVKVPILNKEAEKFDKGLNQLEFKNLLFTITPENKFALLSGEIYNPTNNKTYQYNSQQLIKYKQNNIVANFGKPKVNITKEFSQTIIEEKADQIVIGSSDVDIKGTGIKMLVPFIIEFNIYLINSS
jgi:hypothetical protein